MLDDANLPQPDNQPDTKHVFISYSSVDRPIVSQIAQKLKGNGYPVWVDNVSNDLDGRLVAGDPWAQQLANALNQSILVVLAISPNSLKSKWVGAEIKRAREINRKIIPIRVRPLDDESKKLWGERDLDDLHNLDASCDPDKGIDNFEKGTDQLLHDLSVHLKPLTLARVIHESTSDNEKIVAIDELIKLADNTNKQDAVKVLGKLLSDKDPNIVVSVLQRLKATSVPLHAGLVPQLRILKLHPDVTVADWASSLL